MREKIMNFLLKPAFLFSMAMLLLASSAIGSAQAALIYHNDNYYRAQISVSSIGVSLTENGETVGRRDYRHKDDKWDEESGQLLSHLTEGDDAKVVPGKKYEEKIGVTNSGSIDTYVRVILTKSWKDKDGIKDSSLSPDLIDLNLTSQNGWVVDEKASTPERTVLYYTNVLAAGAAAPDLSDTIKIDGDIAKKVLKTVTPAEGGHKTITTKYAYDGYQFDLSAEVDAVQTHNAKDAIKSAWGVDVNVSGNGKLSLK